jgi:PAS domain-containing protein
MDITGLVTQKNAEAGIWARVELYGRKQDFELCILGNDSDAVQKFNRVQMKKIRLNAKELELNDEAVDTVLDSSDDGVLVRVAGIRGLQFDKKHKEFLGYEPVILEGEELKDDKESYQILIEKIPAIKDFVLKFSGNRANFLAERKKN